MLIFIVIVFVVYLVYRLVLAIDDEEAKTTEGNSKETTSPAEPIEEEVITEKTVDEPQSEIKVEEVLPEKPKKKTRTAKSQKKNKKEKEA